MEKLQGMIKPHLFQLYIMSGSFIETSPRSNVTYLFRKCKPTVAFSSWGGKMNPIACLCLHGIGYYHGKFAGVMCPTDDIISHLTLMRGDERRFWSMANQHSIDSVQGGL